MLSRVPQGPPGPHSCKSYADEGTWSREGLEWRKNTEDTDARMFVPQSSCLRLSQSMCWRSGGIILQSHATSTRVICANPQQAAAPQVCFCSVLIASLHSRNLSSKSALAAPESPYRKPGCSPGLKDAAAGWQGSLLRPQQHREVVKRTMRIASGSSGKELFLGSPTTPVADTLNGFLSTSSLTNQTKGMPGLVRHKSAGPPARLASVRTLKGPCLRVQPLRQEKEQAKCPPVAKNVVVRPPNNRSERAASSAASGGLRVSTASSSAEGHSASNSRGKAPKHSASDNMDYSEDGTSNSSNRGGPGEYSSSLPTSGAKESRSLSLTSESMWERTKGPRIMSTTEAYFGRVPRAPIDIQRLGLRKPQGGSVTKSSQGGFELSDPEVHERFQIARKSTKILVNGALQEKESPESFKSNSEGERRKSDVMLAAEGREAPRKKNRRTKEKTDNIRKHHDTLGNSSRNAEATAAMRAMSAAAASAAAAAEARLATAGPLPAWRQKQQQLQQKTKKSLFLHRGISFPISLFAKVKAKFSRFKSDKSDSR
ncbi:uncharacterized protein LOC113147454 [Cyclospora cayetanensis]|uniref:Uncharacterized protein LOC113147454 n=1 Tax=Cyclospora cayetanensis TaxID=88456 RepID=A0A6P6S3K9_9EIME|nr:uncharacterized protein LOC113147454 [Cyclospora cayetanensis]